MSGCSTETRERIRSLLFEEAPTADAPPPKPVVRQPRRQPLASLHVPQVVEEAPAPATGPAALPPRRAWQDVLRQLPKDAAGGADWARALEEKLIEPKPGLEPEAQSQPVFPLDVELTPQGQPLFKATFPHKSHTEWLACANCHPAIFKMQRGADPITMAKIFGGEYCGHCHGKVAFAVPTGCPRCHLALAGPK